MLHNCRRQIKQAKARCDPCKPCLMAARTVPGDAFKRMHQENSCYFHHSGRPNSRASPSQCCHSFTFIHPKDINTNSLGVSIASFAFPIFSWLSDAVKSLYSQLHISRCLYALTKNGSISLTSCTVVIFISCAYMGRYFTSIELPVSKQQCCTLVLHQWINVWTLDGALTALVKGYGLGFQAENDRLMCRQAI